LIWIQNFWKCAIDMSNDVHFAKDPIIFLNEHVDGQKELGDKKLQFIILKKHSLFLKCVIQMFLKYIWIFNIDRFQESFATCQWGIMQMTYEEKL